MLFTSGPFKPGYVTEAQAAELNRLWGKVAAFDRLATTAPLTVRRLGDGQVVIGLDVGAPEDPAGSSTADHKSFVVHRNPRCENGHLVYDAVTITAHGPVWFEED